MDTTNLLEQGISDWGGGEGFILLNTYLNMPYFPLDTCSNTPDNIHNVIIHAYIYMYT